MLASLRLRVKKTPAQNFPGRLRNTFCPRHPSNAPAPRMKPWQTFLLGLALGTLATAVALKTKPPLFANDTSTLRPNPASVSRPPNPAQPASTKLDAQIAKIFADARTNEFTTSKIPKENDSALREWSARDPHAAIKAIVNAPQLLGRYCLLGYPLAELCAKDPAATLQWLRSNIPNEDDISEATQTLMRLLTQHAPEQAITFCLLPESTASYENFSSAYSALARRDLTRARELLPTLPGKFRSNAEGAIAEVWVQSEPIAAQAWARERPPSRATNEINSGIFKGLLKVDPRSAAEWWPKVAAIYRHDRLLSSHLHAHPEDTPHFYEHLSQGRETHILIGALCKLFEKSPDTALELVAQHQKPEVIEQFIFPFSQWLEADRPAALAWYESLSVRNANLPTDYLESLKLALNPSPTDALTKVVQLPATPTNIKLFNERLPELFGDELKLAAQLVAENPQFAQEDSYSEIVFQLMAEDAATALEWLSARPAGISKDKAITTAAYFMASFEPTVLTQLLAGISDPARRNSAQFETYKNLRTRQTPAAADAWLDTLPLSEDVRQSWRAIVKADD